MKQYKHAKQIEKQHMNNSWQTENGDRMCCSFVEILAFLLLNQLL